LQAVEAGKPLEIDGRVGSTPNTDALLGLVCVFAAGRGLR
jgi:hypothetical protein